MSNSTAMAKNLKKSGPFFFKFVGFQCACASRALAPLRREQVILNWINEEIERMNFSVPDRSIHFISYHVAN